MNDMQLTIVPDGTPEQAQAMGLHYEIINAAQVAASSLLDLGRKLKQMRDTAGYKHLGFDSFEQYTETAVGIRQRQAYKYITIVEKVPAQLIEENAAAGVTKLALLARLGPEDQRDTAPDLANITVTELQALLAEKNGLAEQLTMLQDQSIEAPAEEVDMDAALDAVREEERQRAVTAMNEAIEETRRKAKQSEAVAVQLAKDEANQKMRAAEQEHRKQIEKLMKKADAARAAGKEEAEAETAQKILEARQQATAAARREQEDLYKAKLEEARQAAEQAQKTIEELRMQADQDSLKFSMLFEQLQEKAHQLMALSDQMTRTGSGDKANKLRKALQGALHALADQAEGGGSDD